jgi:hypothetical protein
MLKKLAILATSCSLTLSGVIAIFTPAITNANQASTLEQALRDKTYGNITSPQDFNSGQEAGNIVLKKGVALADTLPLSAVAKLKEFSPANALAASGVDLDLSKVQLGELKFLKEASLESVVKANPAIANLTAESVGWPEEAGKTLGQLAASGIGKSPLPETVLKSNSISQFGDIANTPYSQYTDVANQPISNFMGVADVPLSKLNSIATAPGAGKVIAQIKMDRVNTKETAKGINHRITSGSNKEPHAPCTKEQNNCSALEINGGMKIPGVVGSMWMVNQQLKGGTGLTGEFATAAGIREYAGYEIPGTDFKVVAIDSDARKGTAQIRLDMKINTMAGSTPYFLPLLPITVSEENGDIILPVEIAPVATTMANPTNGSSTPTASINKTIPTEPTQVATPAVVTNTYDAYENNIKKGNIGPAAKTDAPNPSIEGVL